MRKYTKQTKEEKEHTVAELATTLASFILSDKPKPKTYKRKKKEPETFDSLSGLMGGIMGVSSSGNEKDNTSEGSLIQSVMDNLSSQQEEEDIDLEPFTTKVSNMVWDVK